MVRVGCVNDQIIFKWLLFRVSIYRRSNTASFPGPREGRSDPEL